MNKGLKWGLFHLRFEVVLQGIMPAAAATAAALFKEWFCGDWVMSSSMLPMPII